MTDTPRRLEYMPLADLRSRMDPRNPKAHAADDLDASVGRFGYTEPIVLDERTGMLVAGHGRVEALTRLQGEAETAELPDGLMAADDDWAVPVVRGWASTDDAEAGAYLVASNRLTEAGGWNSDQLSSLADLIRDTEASYSGTGIDDAWLSDMLAGVTPPSFQPSDGDDQPRLDRKFHLVCNKCGTAIDPGTAERVEQ